MRLAFDLTPSPSPIKCKERGGKTGAIWEIANEIINSYPSPPPFTEEGTLKLVTRVLVIATSSSSSLYYGEEAGRRGLFEGWVETLVGKGLYAPSGAMPASHKWLWLEDARQGTHPLPYMMHYCREGSSDHSGAISNRTIVNNDWWGRLLRRDENSPSQ